MSEDKQQNMTNIVGYFNPQKYSIFIEISEINLKAELAPNAYIRDRSGKFINDPIFEPYVHAKGLARSTSKQAVPVNYAPRFVKADRPAASVTQAAGFVRQEGRTVPTYQPQQNQKPREVAVNKAPVTGMTVETARKLGLVGKPRLVPEDYGADETTGAPRNRELPDMKYSVESPPRIKTGAPLRPELTEADTAIAPEERARRQQLQQQLNQASWSVSGENFNPEQVKSLPSPSPVPIKAPEAPTSIAPVAPAPPPATAPVPKPLPEPKSKTKRTAPQAQKRKVATVVQPEQPSAPVKVSPVAEVKQETDSLTEEITPGSGVVQALDETPLPPPVLDPPPANEEGKRFICAADGLAFPYRSELERHVKRKFPAMYQELMAPYPP